MILKFNKFINESKFYVSEGLVDVLNYISTNPISKKLLSLINKDVDITFNAINITDKSDIISFVSDSQLQNKISKGLNISDIFNGDGMKLQMSSVLRTTKRIMEDCDEFFSHTEYVNFCEQFKAAWKINKLKNENKELPIKVVSGDDIKYWYSEEQYSDKTLDGYGTLSKSCMRFEECQDFFSIYIDNPDKINMVILINDDNKLLARALIWKTNVGMYLDRIYYTEPSEEELIKLWFKNEYNSEMIYPNMKEMKLSINDVYDKYPYMDTFQYYDMEDKVLSNYLIDGENDVYILDDTDGDAYLNI